MSGGLRAQFIHVIDVVPTLLEVTGIKAPEHVNGIKQEPIEGISFAYTFDKKNAKAPSKHETQYFEMMGKWAIYHDGWMLKHQGKPRTVGSFRRRQSRPAEQPSARTL